MGLAEIISKLGRGKTKGGDGIIPMQTNPKGMELVDNQIGLRPAPAEVLVHDDDVRLLRRHRGEQLHVTLLCAVRVHRGRTQNPSYRMGGLAKDFMHLYASGSDFL